MQKRAQNVAASANEQHSSWASSHFLIGAASFLRPLLPNDQEVKFATTLYPGTRRASFISSGWFERTGTATLRAYNANTLPEFRGCF